MLQKKENIFQERFLMLIVSVSWRWEEGFCVVNLLTGPVIFRIRESCGECPMF
jgi:hypothetical protein